MNLKGFKKVHEDDEKAVLQNERGHSFNIAKKALSKKHLSALKELPLHSAGGSFVDKFMNNANQNQYQPPLSSHDEDQSPENPTSISTTAPQPSGSSGPGDSSPQAMQDAVSAQPAPDQSSGRAPQSDQDTFAPDESQPEQAQPSAPPAVSVSQNLQQENSKVGQDLLTGHINPTTYSDLFAKKDTLGKIGTLFGLLVSGAGSGLAHQPNAVFQMMGKELDNDIDAQKTSATNAQNLYKLNLQNQMQQAQIPKMLAEGRLTQEQAKVAAADAQTKALALTQMNSRIMAFHNLSQAAQKTPLGSPQRQTLAAMWPLVQNENLGIADQAAAASEALSSNMGPSSGGSGPINYNKFNQLERASQMKLPGAPSGEDLSKMTSEAGQAGDVNLLKNDFMGAYDKVNNMVAAGKFSPHLRDALTKPLIAKATKLGEGRYTEAANEAYSSMLPQVGDSPDTRKQKRVQAERFFGDLAGSTPTLSRFGVKNQSSQPAEIRYDKQGNGWQMGPNGKPIRVK